MTTTTISASAQADLGTWSSLCGLRLATPGGEQRKGRHNPQLVPQKGRVGPQETGQCASAAGAVR